MHHQISLNERKINMITALIQFKLPKPVTRAQAQETFLSTAPKYRGIPGLVGIIP